MKKENMVTRTFDEMSVNILMVDTVTRTTKDEFFIMDATDNEKEIMEYAKEFFQNILERKNNVPVMIISKTVYSVKYSIPESVFKRYATEQKIL